MSAARGRLIVFEGPEGVGKSTQLRLVANWLAARGISHVALREPGGTPLGDQIRRLLLEPGGRVSDRAEALLFMASRAELVREAIAPALARGDTVLLDRFFLSTYAYQIHGRGLPAEEVRRANALATAGLVPDLTVLLLAESAERRARAEARGAPDRMERAGDAFHERVEQAFASFLSPGWQRRHPECGPILGVDGAGEPMQVFDRVLATLGTRWPETFSALDESHPT